MDVAPTSRRSRYRSGRLACWVGATLIASGVLATTAGASVDDITVSVVPNPAEQSETVALEGYCDYSTGETFTGASGSIDGNPFTLSPDGGPVDVGGGLTRQNLTGTATAPSTPGSYTVGAGCVTDISTGAGLQDDLVVTATTTTTTAPATTTTTAPATTTTTAPVETTTVAPPGMASGAAPLSFIG